MRLGSRTAYAKHEDAVWLQRASESNGVIDAQFDSPGPNEIGQKLNDTHLAIICITPVSENAAWVNFEAGALSKSIADSRVIPWVLDPTAGKALQGPLGQFQARLATKEDTFEIVKDLAKLGGLSSK